MSNLIHPVTKQPCAFVARERGMVAIRCNYVSRQVRWFDLQLMQLCNPAIDIPSLIPQDFDSGLLYTCAEPPKPLTVVLTPEMVAHVNASALVDIVVRKPAPVISLWSEGLRVA